MLSQKTRYALKALLELAALPAGATLPSAAISARRRIPVKFLEAILAEMKHDGLVRGQRGRSGGYRLARRAEEISFGSVIRLMEGPLGLLPCVSVTQYDRCADCAAAQSCARKVADRPLAPMRRFSARRNKTNSTQEEMPAEMVSPATPQRGWMPNRCGRGSAKR